MKVIYKCGDCGQSHDEEHDAVLCCAPEPVEAYECEECNTEHSCSDMAEKCCGADLRCPVCARDYAEKSLNGVAIRVAGHCNRCNPFFTLDQDLRISDVFHLETGAFGCILTGSVHR